MALRAAVIDQQAPTPAIKAAGHRSSSSSLSATRDRSDTDEAGIVVAVVIPCYRVRDHILDVLAGLGPGVQRAYVVDDACPDGSGDLVADSVTDARVTVLRHDTNQGVGGAVKTGYRRALADGADIVVKLDGDGQMDPADIPALISPLLDGSADYTKGNRFFDVEHVRQMPRSRLAGNAVLSLLTKLSSGYWDVFDPTNGYTAITATALARLPLDKISDRYFFETDLLFRLNTIRAVVADVPLPARYGDAPSSLRIRLIVGEFMVGHLRNLGKRLAYNYYLRDMSLASIELPLGVAMMVFGVVYGLAHWVAALGDTAPTPTGTVMLAVLPIILGFQLILAFLAYDISSVPRRPLRGGRPGATTPPDPDGSRTARKSA